MSAEQDMLEKSLSDLKEKTTTLRNMLYDLLELNAQALNVLKYSFTNLPREYEKISGIIMNINKLLLNITAAVDNSILLIKSELMKYNEEEILETCKKIKDHGLLEKLFDMYIQISKLKYK